MESLHDVAERTLRQVLARELRMTDLELDDDLVRLMPEFPEEEVIMDVFEEFGYRGEEPIYSHWSGTFGDLLRIVVAELERLGSEPT